MTLFSIISHVLRGYTRIKKNNETKQDNIQWQNDATINTKNLPTSLVRFGRHKSANIQIQLQSWCTRGKNKLIFLFGSQVVQHCSSDSEKSSDAVRHQMVIFCFECHLMRLLCLHMTHQHCVSAPKGSLCHTHSEQITNHSHFQL